jgi:CBS domain containing-hemolysin-like protein
LDFFWAAAGLSQVVLACRELPQRPCAGSQGRLRGTRARARNASGYLVQSLPLVNHQTYTDLKCPVKAFAYFYTPMSIGDFILLLTSILLSAFFSGIEIAFISGNKLKLELEKSRKGFTGRILNTLTQSPSRFIATMLVGNNLALVVYGLIMGNWLTPLISKAYVNQFGPQGAELSSLVLQTIAATVLILFVGEYLPKAIFALQPNKMLSIFSRPTYVFYVVLKLPVILITGFSNLVVRKVLKIKTNQHSQGVDLADLNYYLRQLTEEAKDERAEVENEVFILQNALEFPSVKARECMIPRNEITAIEKSAEVEMLRKSFVESGHSKIVVYSERIDEVIGFVHSFDLFTSPQSINSILRPVFFVAETTPIKDIMTQFIQQHKSLAIVVDEYGGTAGLITLEDIIEELVGEIQDEHDKEVLTDKQLDEHTYLWAGRLEIDALNDKYNLDIPEHEDYETLAGFILFHHQEIPEQGDEIKIGAFRFLMTQVSERNIQEVRVRIVQED